MPISSPAMRRLLAVMQRVSVKNCDCRYIFFFLRDAWFRERASSIYSKRTCRKLLSYARFGGWFLWAMVQCCPSCKHKRPEWRTSNSLVLPNGSNSLFIMDWLTYLFFRLTRIHGD